MRRDRALDAWLRDAPPAWPTLPWSGGAAARASLDGERVAWLRAFEARLRASWQSPTPHREAAEAFAALDPDSRLALYPGSPPGGPRWFLQSITTGAVTAEPLRHHHVLHEVRLYELEGPDPFADRPVALPALTRFAPRRDRAPEFVERLLHPNDIHHQLRMVLYREGRAELYAGFYRRRRARPFDLRDHAVLLAVRPALRAWLDVGAAIGTAPLGDGALVGALAAIRAPALLLRRGRVVHANALGAAHVDGVLRWVGAGRPAGYATSTPLRPGGVEVELVVIRASRAAPAITPPLPPSLARVAALLHRGASDKEIAEQLALPHATARTYVHRTMQRFRTRDRRTLLLSSRGGTTGE